MSKLIILAVLAIASVCQAKPPQKVVNGELAAEGEFPYIVSLVVNGRHHCGGSIIGDKWIVTAAHCVMRATTKPYDNLRIRTGSLSSIDGGKLYKAKNVYYHGEYLGDATSANDIGLIELDTKIAFDKNTKAIEIASGPTPTGRKAVGAGWGFQAGHSGRLSAQLHKVEMTTVDPATCQNYHQTPLYTHQICAVGAPGSGICQGDSGGPLAVGNKLVGIVSYGLPCALGPPDVFSSAYHYADWIKGVQDGTLRPAQQNNFGYFYPSFIWTLPPVY